MTDNGTFMFTYPDIGLIHINVTEVNRKEGLI